MTKVFKSGLEWMEFRKNLKCSSLGFVPTMGALHDGHASLIRRSATENKKTLLSIFVNPAQFDDPEDLQKYPRTLEDDLRKAAEAGANFVLLPEASEIYSDSYRYQVIEKNFSRQLCGKNRPGHFEGVLTVVMKLLNIAAADRAYFGKKDYQQFLLIRDMAKAFFMDTEIIGLPTVRESDGLAMSSRNALLTKEERAMAAGFYKTLKSAAREDEAFFALNSAGFKCEYVTDLDHRRFAAVRLGSVRLIDNVQR